MNDREKMLADLREAFDDVFTGDLENAKHFVVRYRDKLEALLNEPTLEEVLAELDKYGHPQIWKDGGGWMCSIFKPSNNGFTQDHPTPLQAARECLRRVTE